MGHPNLLVWLSGYVGYLLLATVIVVRKRYKEFRWFSALLAFDILHSSCLVMLMAANNRKAYGAVFLVGEIIETVIRVGVIFELARMASRHISDSSNSNARWIWNSLVVGSFLTVLMVWNMKGLHNVFASVAVKVSFGAAIMGWVLAFTLFLIAFFSGIHLRVHSQVITYGLAVYFTGKILTGVVLLLGERGMWVTAQNMLQPVYIACLYTWCVALWFDEPKWVLNWEMYNFKTFVHKMSLAISK